MTRAEFEILPRKTQKKLAKQLYTTVRKEIINDHWEAENAYQDGELRTQTHHCWEKGMGGAIPLWYYFQKDNLLFWSLTYHHYYHFMPKNKWTKKMKVEFQKCEEIKQAMKDDDRAYRGN